MLPIYFSIFTFPFSDLFHIGTKFHKYDTSFSYQFDSTGIGLPYGHYFCLPYPRPFFPQFILHMTKPIVIIYAHYIFIVHL
jgi:hypothetical protein